MVDFNQPFAEKYRPKVIKDCVLPKNIKTKFEEFVKKEYFPNLLLAGTAGTGKTTIAKCICNELEYDYKIINASLDRGIDVLRNEIQQYVSTLSIDGSKKVIILDEADNLTHNFQSALRNFMEEFSGHCGFILTCNYKNKIIEPLHSRCAVIDFNCDKTERKELIKDFFKRVCFILEKEGIEYDKKSVLLFISNTFPDNRKILNEIQAYSSTGKIDEGLLSQKTNVDIDRLVKILKDNNFKECLKWVKENKDMDSSVIFRNMFDKMEDVVPKEAIPSLVLILSEYQYKSSLVVDQEINLVAMMIEIMSECF